MTITKTLRLVGRPVFGLIAVTVALVVMDRGPLAQTPNPTSNENGLAGDLASSWDINGAGDPSIQGFATDISVNKGGIVSFKIKTDSANYKIDIYRLGYYGGRGARNVASLGTFTQPQNQTAICATGPTTGLVDCGTWTDFPTSWTV